MASHRTPQIPRRLRPARRQLPGLAWCAARRLVPDTAVRPIGHLAAAALFLALFVQFAASHADHALAARHLDSGERAVLACTRYSPRPSLRYYMTASVGTILFVLAGATVTIAIPDAATSVTGPLASELIGLAIRTTALVSMISGLWAMAQLCHTGLRTRRQLAVRARRIAHARGCSLIHAICLASSPGGGPAVTSLILALRREADTQHIAVLAEPRNTALGHRYQHLGFVPLDPDRQHFLLYLPASGDPQ